MRNDIFIPAFAFSSLRSALYTLEFGMLNTLQFLLPGSARYKPVLGNDDVLAIRREVNALLKRDAQNIAAGLYPIEVLRPESPMRHFSRLPRIIADGLQIYHRRNRGRTTEFDEKAREFLADVPRYYRRNFHFQTGGYLSRKSAELYEHQVEMLFGGSADAMRRLILAPMKKHFGKTDGRGLAFLEIGAGTGRATRFVRMAFPRAKIVAVDLSDPYLKIAAENLKDFSRVDFVQADGAKQPFRDAQFDAVYSVFLFHELPLTERKAVLAESARVLRSGGFHGFVDSIQTGDNPVFDRQLVDFPHRYHEPYYRNYIASPMNELLEEVGFAAPCTELGFFSKACWAAKLS